MVLTKIYFKVSFSIILCCILSFGSSQEFEIITLKRAIASAVSNYPVLKTKGFQYESANATIKDAKHQNLPSLKIHDQIDLGTSNGIGGSYFPLGIIPSTSGGIRSENNSNLFSGNVGAAYFEYELYNFGLSQARVHSAQSFAKSSKADYDATSYSLQFHVAQLYFYLLQYRLLTNIQQKNIERYQVLYNYIKAYTSNGLKAGVDSSIANAEISKAKIQYIQSLEKYNILKSELSYYVGLKNNFEIDTSLYNLTDSTLNSLRFLISIDSVRGNNPLLTFYNSRLEFAKSQKELIRKSFLPKVYLVGGAWMRGSSISSKDNYGDLSSGLDYSRFNYLTGLALTYNIIDLIHQKDKEAIQFYQVEAVHEELKEHELLLKNQLQQADIEIQSVLDKQKEIPIQLKAAQEAYSQKSAQYSAGLANVVELTDASYLLYRAETDAVDTRSDLLNTLLRKAFTNNTLDRFLILFK